MGDKVIEAKSAKVRPIREGEDKVFFALGEY
jgi:hypothetical protein